MIKYVSQRLIEDEQIEIKDIKDKYFKILDYLLKYGEFDLFNKFISKFTKEYNCISYEKHGELMIKYGLYELATDSFIKAIELNSTNSKSYSYIAERFAKINEIDDALDFAFTALNLDKENIDAYDIIISIYKTIGNIDKVKEIQVLKKQNILSDRWRED
jgi:tetratricopeptide (TPR) repeat protein